VLRELVDYLLGKHIGGLYVCGTTGEGIYMSMDEQCLFAAMFGSSGNIGSTLNFMPGVYREIHECVKSGDLARGQELQLRANQVTKTVISFGFPGALKKVMGILGFDC
jgi:N-acetylneuraminate lyase